MEVTELIKSFPKSMIIDFNKHTVWFVKDGRLKVYSKKYYNDIIKKIMIDENDV